VDIVMFGTGAVGQALAGCWKRIGHCVTFASRDPAGARVRALAADTGIPVVGIDEAGPFDAGVLAVPWGGVPELCARIASRVSGRVMLDATNPLAPGLQLAIGHAVSGGEQIASWLPQANIVKIFNTTGYGNLADPRYGAERPTMFYCGDDAPSCAVARQLAEDIGFEAVCAGPLSESRTLPKNGLKVPICCEIMLKDTPIRACGRSGLWRRLMKFFAMIAAGLMGLCLGPAQVQAADASFPSRPIKILVPFAPGGTSDNLARTLANAMQSRLKVSVIVENKPGGSGAIAIEDVAHAPANGYTLLWGTDAVVVQPLLHKDFPVKVERDLEPLARVGYTPMLFVANKRLPADNIQQLISMAKANPGKLRYGSGGTGTVLHITGERFNLAAGIDIAHIPICESAIHNVMANNYGPDDVRLYVTNPAGINIFQVCFNMLTGMTTVLDDYDTVRFLELVAEHRVTTITVIPTILRRLIDEIKSGHYDVSSLKQVCYGTMPITPALIRTAYDTLGCTFMQRYGVSESAGAVAALRDSDHRLALQGEPELLTSVGRPLLHADVSIRGDDGSELPRGELGTVWIRSETLMSGYLNRPEETAEALALPWLRTGDFGRMDERGYIYLGDRKKHMIISGGMNVYPLGVENALAEHPAVREAVVVGMPHPEWGEAVVAAVSLVPGVRVRPDELIAHCKQYVAKYETPKHVEVFDTLPQGNTNKIDKKRIKELLRDKMPWAIEVE